MFHSWNIKKTSIKCWFSVKFGTYADRQSEMSDGAKPLRTL
uniref:Uncharacterized protein n=1 Tax=Anguilla anguilla TaxID=7936 RepID=A0A0E9R2N3_ANGAN